ncbi:7-cyano-7-deazaguanine synthase [Halobacteriales archaeon QS_1_68_20]|nr:MAG: 7-cyano-7-deazaguanine synthase [Halobacteriales archaeon QS_1_68_20]
MTKAFVLLSGGIDSAVCLQRALADHDDVAAIHVDYGQQTEDIERRNAEAQADAAGIALHVLDYRDVFRHFAEGTIRDREYDSDETTEAGHSVGYVPQRNLHMLVSAAALAEHETETGRDVVLYLGAQGGDEADYPDCRPEFVQAARAAVDRSTDQHEIRIETPLLDRSKADVLELGDQLGVDWSLTFSCYNDADGDPCGECPACLERSEAFERAGITDPVAPD